MYVSMYVCMCSYMYVYMSVCMCVCVCVCVCCRPLSCGCCFVLLTKWMLIVCSYHVCSFDAEWSWCWGELAKLCNRYS